MTVTLTINSVGNVTGQPSTFRASEFVIFSDALYLGIRTPWLRIRYYQVLHGNMIFILKNKVDEEIDKAPY